MRETEECAKKRGRGLHLVFVRIKGAVQRAFLAHKMPLRIHFAVIMVGKRKVSTMQCSFPPTNGVISLTIQRFQAL